MSQSVIRNASIGVRPPEEDLSEEETNYEVPRLSVGIGECKIIRDDFGYYRESGMDEGKVVHRFTLLNREITVQILTYGATILAITMPDKNGIIDDVVMGFDSFEEYKNSRNPYFGATIGRITGIIPQCEFSIEDEKYFVSNNFLASHHANGGMFGFDKVMWNAYVSNDKLYMTYMSQDGEEGFPGDVLVTRCYELTNNNELLIETVAKCTKPTPIDITTHVDWNLYGHSGGPEELYNHYLMVNADKYGQLDKEFAITGKLKKVSRTILEFRIPRPVGKTIHKIPGGGFDHFMSLTRGCRKSVTFAAKLMHPPSGRYIEVLTDQPGLLIYSQNNLFAHKNVVAGHPISCWVNDATFLLEQQKVVFDYGDFLPEDEFDVEDDKDNVEEEEVGEDGEGGFMKEEYGPLIGKQNARYVRHGGIRLVPMNYPEPIARRKDYVNYIIKPGETYLNTTIFKFGVKYEKPINLAEVMAPDIGLEEEIAIE